MIDNEIKALERHLESNNGFAKMEALKALNIIKRQRDEIEGLIVGQETLQKHIAKLNKELERANIKNENHLAAIEGLKNLVNSLSNA